MTEKLKPCPFCGGSNIESRVCDYGTKLGGKPYIVGCRDCNISTSMLPQVAKLKGYKSAKEAAEATWNTRAADENPPLTLDELRQMTGEPVWVETMQEWRIVCVDRESEFIRLYTVFNTISAKHVLENNGLVYRRKPEVQND